MLAGTIVYSIGSVDDVSTARGSPSSVFPFYPTTEARLEKGSDFSPLLRGKRREPRGGWAAGWCIYYEIMYFVFEKAQGRRHLGISGRSYQNVVTPSKARML
jgi:hypothetical protein